MADAAKLEVRGVSVVYRNPKGPPTVALDGVSLSVRDGEFVSIVGPSGCGKSTLLSAVDGLTPISRGGILLNGKQIKKPGRDRAVVFQSPALLPWRSVLSNVQYGLELQGYAKAERLQRAQRALEVVGLTGFQNAHPHQLSGGMRQRVNLARALVCDPQILLLDEPFAALDAQTREVMQAELLRIWNLNRITAMFITHQIDEALYLSDRVVVMSARPGRVIDEITVQIPPPPPLSVKQTPGFLELQNRIWSQLQEEGKKALA